MSEPNNRIEDRTLNRNIKDVSKLVGFRFKAYLNLSGLDCRLKD